MAVKSSYIDLCVFDGKSGWCEGFGRSRKEAHEWRKLTPYKAISRALEGRMTILRQQLNIDTWNRRKGRDKRPFPASSHGARRRSGLFTSQQEADKHADGTGYGQASQRI